MTEEGKTAASILKYVNINIKRCEAQIKLLQAKDIPAGMRINPEIFAERNKFYSVEAQVKKFIRKYTDQVMCVVSKDSGGHLTVKVMSILGRPVIMSKEKHGADGEVVIGNYETKGEIKDAKLTI